MSRPSTSGGARSSSESVEMAKLPLPPMVHSGAVPVFACGACGVEVTRDLELLDPPPKPPEELVGHDGDNWVPVGRYLRDAGPWKDWTQHRLEGPIVNEADLLNTLPHPTGRGGRMDAVAPRATAARTSSAPTVTRWPPGSTTAGRSTVSGCCPRRRRRFKLSRDPRVIGQDPLEAAAVPLCWLGQASAASPRSAIPTTHSSSILRRGQGLLPDRKVG